MRIYRIANMYDDMSEDDFVDYHRTGFIPSDAYENYKTKEGLAWIQKSRFPELYSTQQFGDKTIEFRKRGEKLQYVKTDEDGEIVRGRGGVALYLSEDEAKEKKLQLYDATITAFDGEEAIGLASNEFGTDGVWVAEDYQGVGIGTYLLRELRKQFPEKRRIGQMTDAGEKMTRSYYRSLMRDKLNTAI